MGKTSTQQSGRKKKEQTEGEKKKKRRKDYRRGHLLLRKHTSREVAEEGLIQSRRRRVLQASKPLKPSLPGKKEGVFVWPLCYGFAILGQFCAKIIT